MAAICARVVAGYDDGTFRPEKTLTREQMAVMLARYYIRSGVTAQGSPDFADAARISGWAVDGVGMCAEQKTDALPAQTTEDAQQSQQDYYGNGGQSGDQFGGSWPFGFGFGG